jgi:hypothetical protein
MGHKSDENDQWDLKTLDEGNFHIVQFNQIIDKIDMISEKEQKPLSNMIKVPKLSFFGIHSPRNLA